MTSGIYVLKFNGTDRVYVGQSVNIETRYRAHKQKLRNGSHNYKMLEAYKLYGIPELEIICECTKNELNRLEQEAFEIYDSINNGFNISEDPDIYQEGEKNGYSKYTNDQIREVFKYLLDISYRYKDIESLTGVKLNTVRHIANGESHSWLATEFPIEYADMLSIKGADRQASANCAKTLGKIYPKVISPTGETFEVTNANAFARKYGLDSSYFIKLLNKRALSCKGWKLA